MKKVGLLALIIMAIVASYIYKAPIVIFAENIFYKSPCDTPITFRIGNIDPKYNLTTNEFVSSINEAGSIWSTQENKKLFAYDPIKGEIQINLVYDQRQFLTSQINDLNSKVKMKQNELDPKIADYKRRAAEFRSQINQLNTDIEYWNSKGGAPVDEYEKLKSRQINLQAEAKNLQQEASSLNQSTDEYNAQVGELHQTVDTFNEALSYKPEEGEYIYDNGTQTINIYFDNSQTELIHTLSHELGHALTLPHNNDSQSIMYPRTTEAVSLSAQDKAGLEKACEKKSVIKTEAQKIALIINRIRLKYSR